ncbi:phage tail tape measure protein, partial [Methylobacterium aquaticum]|uniref:phage tail tape measure protein n=1 Tax=Methylobacterium aquaticum TaxID=270351 RepID=UPI003D169D4D
MANLDVALRLRLINGLKAPAGEAKRDLDALRGAAQRLNGVRAGGLAADLGRVATAAGRADDALRRTAGHRTGLAATGTAAARLGADLGTVAGRAGQADAAMKRLGAERSGLVAVGTASARLGADLSGLAAGAVRTDAALRRLGTDRTGLVATGSASARLGADLSRLTATAGRTDAALRRLGAERAGLAAGSTAVSRLGNDLRTLERAAARADGALDRVGAARSGLSATGSATARLGGELAGAARNAGRLADNLTRATAVVPRIRAPQVEGPAPGPWGPRPTGPVHAPHPRPVRPAPRPHAPLAPEDEQRARAAAGAEGGTILALGNKAIAAAGGIYVARAAMRATVGEAISFEKAWAEVVKKINDAPNPEAMQQLQRSVAKTAIELGLSRNGLAEMTAEAGAAGIKFQDLERYVRLAAKASVGWDMTPRDAAQNLAEIKSAGQLSIAEMDVLADKINALGDNSAAKERDIVEMFQRAAAAAKQAGSGTDTTLAALTALRSGGMQPEVAARFYGAFTSKLRTAGGEGKGAEKVNDALKEIGLNGKKVAQDMARDADTAISDVLTRLAKHADPVKVAKGLMGEEWWDELARFTGGTLAEFTKQREFLRNPLNFKGSLDKGLDTQLSTTANHFERLKALAGDIGDRMGRWTLPGINQGIEAAIRQMDEWERRRDLQKTEQQARGEDPGASNPIGRATTAIIKGVPVVLDKILDLTVARLPTDDRSRLVVKGAAKRAQDARQAAEKARTEASTLEERAKGAKDKTARAILLEQAKREREAASRHDASAAEATRGAGPAGARDMTDVEFGEAAARASIETKRRIALMERGLAAGRPNVRIPETGVVMGREAALAELLAQRKRLEALGGPPAEPPAPAPTPAAPPAPVMTVPLPPARPDRRAAPVTPLPPARPASLTPPAAPVRPEPTAQPDATIQPAPTIQPQPTIQPT